MGMSPRLELRDFGELLRERAWLDRLVAGMVREASDRDDIAQRALVHCIEARGPIRNVKAYLASVARGFALNRHRERVTRERREQIAAEPEISPQSDPALLAERAEMQQQVIEALLELEEPRRTVLLLRFHGEVSTEEIASKLGIPAPTVRSHLRRGLEQLRDRFDRDPSKRPWRAILLPTVSTRTAGVAAALFTGGMLVKWKITAAVAAAIAAGVVGATIQSPRSKPNVVAPSAPIETPEIAASIPAATDVQREAVDVEVPPSVVIPTVPSSSAGMGRATLRGRVIRQGTSEPIADVAVYLEGSARRSPTGSTEIAKTAGDGSFVIDDLEVGLQLGFEMKRDGALSSIHELTFPSPGSFAVDFQIEPEVRIRGRVIDAASHEPIAGANVNATNRRPGESDRRIDLIADESGAIEFVAPAATESVIHLLAKQQGYATTRMILTDAGEFELPMLRAARIEGSVRRADGTIATKAMVVAWSTKLDKASIPSEFEWPPGCSLVSASESRVVDSIGRFVLEGVAPWSTIELQATEGDDAYTAKTVKTGAPDESLLVDLTFWPAGGTAVLEGIMRVNGKGAPVPYQLIVSGRTKSSQHHAGPNGRFRHEGLPPGIATITPIVPSPSARSRDHQLENGRTTSVEIDLKVETSWVGGRVHRRDGSPVPDVGVAIRATKRDSRVGVKTDAEGRFRIFTTFAPGESLVARVGGGSVFQDVELVGGNEDVSIVLLEIGRVRLRVVDAATQVSIPTPALAWIDPSGARREVMSNSLKKLPGEWIEFELDLGEHRVEVDRSASFYAPAVVTVTARKEPVPQIVEVPAVSTGVVRIEITDAGAIELPKRRMGYCWRPSGSNHPYRRIPSLALSYQQEHLVAIELPAGAIDLGVHDAVTQTDVSLFSALSIVAGQATDVQVREGK